MPEGPNLKQGEAKLPIFAKTFNIYAMGKSSDGVYFDHKISGEQMERMNLSGMLSMEYDHTTNKGALWLATPSEEYGDYLVVDFYNYDIIAEKTGEKLNDKPTKVQRVTGGFTIQHIIEACDGIGKIRDAGIARRQVAQNK